MLMKKSKSQRSLWGCSFIVFALVCLAAGGYPAFGQRISSPSTANVHHFARLPGATTEATEQALVARYREDARLHPGSVVRSASPYGGLDEVDLASRTNRAVS